MIAEPNSSTTSETSGPAASQPSFQDASPLSAAELYHLTLYKWRYSLEAFGFDRDAVRELVFLKWLYASRRLLP